MSIYRNERSEGRSHIVGKIRYSREHDGVCFNARLVDCTRKGIGFVSEYPYLPDTKLFLKSKNDDDTSVQAAQVTWSRMEPSSTKDHPRYRVGAKYVRH